MSKTVSLSARVSQETIDKVNKLVDVFQKESLGKVSQRVVLEKAINDLYIKYVREGE
jgi:hypothetical protein